MPEQTQDVVVTDDMAEAAVEALGSFDVVDNPMAAARAAVAAALLAQQMDGQQPDDEKDEVVTAEEPERITIAAWPDDVLDLMQRLVDTYSDGFVRDAIDRLAEAVSVAEGNRKRVEAGELRVTIAELEAQAGQARARLRELEDEGF